MNTQIKEEIKHTFRNIRVLVDKFTGKPSLDDAYIEQCLLNNLFKLTHNVSSFWTGPILRSNISQLLGLRNCPVKHNAVPFANNGSEKLMPQTKTPPPKDYGTMKNRDFLRLMDINHVDEGNAPHMRVIGHGSNYQVLPISRYWEYVSQDEINYIFDQAFQKNMTFLVFGLFCLLAASREFCHLIFTKDILQRLFGKNTFMIRGFGCNPLMSDPHKEFIYYSLHYAMYVLYKEECLLKAKFNFQSRIVLDVDVIRQIPIWCGPLEKNPFLLSTADESYLNGHRDPQNIIRLLDCEPQGLHSSESFWTRFDIFSDGIFKGINIGDIYFCGSAFSACVINNPLEKLFEQSVAGLIAYFDEYYPSKRVMLGSDHLSREEKLKQEDELSDIDILVDVKTNKDFDAKAQQIFQLIKRNISAKTSKEDLTPDELNLLRIQKDRSYKYYITGTAINRSIEIFRIYYLSPPAGISRFHMPCVRGLAKPYGTALVLPSLWSCAYTGVLLDCRLFLSCFEEIVLKYYLRGFTLILNHREHEMIHEYVKLHKEKYGLLLTSKLACRDINSDVFKPRKNKTSIYYNLVPYGEIIPQHGYQYVERESPNPQPTTINFRNQSGFKQSFNILKLLKLTHDLRN